MCTEALLPSLKRTCYGQEPPEGVSCDSCLLLCASGGVITPKPRFKPPRLHILAVSRSNQPLIERGGPISPCGGKTSLTFAIHRPKVGLNFGSKLRKSCPRYSHLIVVVLVPVWPGMVWPGMVSLRMVSPGMVWLKLDWLKWVWSMCAGTEEQLAGG